MPKLTVLWLASIEAIIGKMNASNQPANHLQSKKVQQPDSTNDPVSCVIDWYVILKIRHIGTLLIYINCLTTFVSCYVHGIFSKRSLDHFRLGEGYLAVVPGPCLPTAYTGIQGKMNYISIKRHCNMHGAHHIWFDMNNG